MIPISNLMLDDEDDRDFLLRLYIDYQALMRKHALKILGNSNDADDCLNEACIKLIQKVSLLKTLDCCTLSAYIVFTVRSVTIDCIKHRDVQNKHTFLGQDEDALDMVSRLPDRSDLAQTVVDGESARSVVKMLGNLPERERNILTYKYVLELSDIEIAGLLDIKPQSVRQYLTRARRNALEILKKGGAESGASI